MSDNYDAALVAKNAELERDWKAAMEAWAEEHRENIAVKAERDRLLTENIALATEQDRLKTHLQNAETYTRASQYTVADLDAKLERFHNALAAERDRIQTHLQDAEMYTRIAQRTVANLNFTLERVLTNLVGLGVDTETST